LQIIKYENEKIEYWGRRKEEFVFDVVFFSGKLIGEKTLKERKKILEKLKFKEPFFVLGFEPLKNLKKSMEKSAKRNYKRVILKELGSKYQISYQAPIATHY
jgi:ATP-dependent DNA ligase